MVLSACSPSFRTKLSIILDVSQAPEAQQLGDENTRLRKLMADLSLDKEALQSVSRKKWVELVALKAAETGSALLVPLS